MLTKTMLTLPAMTPKVDTRSLLTVAAAAKELNISRQAAWEAVDNGRLKKVEIAGVTFVTKKSIQQYRKTRRPGGPKPKR
jgi:hypothetical protein